MFCRGDFNRLFYLVVKFFGESLNKKTLHTIFIQKLAHEHFLSLMRNELEISYAVQLNADIAISYSFDFYIMSAIVQMSAIVLSIWKNKILYFLLKTYILYLKYDIITK